MQVVPWSLVKSWHCNTCGICCRKYNVVLKFPEWLNVVRKYGVEYTVPSINKFFLKKGADGFCVFLYKTPYASFCSLQHKKPQACKLWPFKVLDKPKYGRPNDAAYYYKNQKFFIYVDPACTGIRYGEPSYEFAYSVIPEFVEIAFGVRPKQFKSTAFL